MFTYYFVKARQGQLLREAKSDRLTRTIKRTGRGVGKHKLSEAKGWGNRRLHVTRA